MKHTHAQSRQPLVAILRYTLQTCFPARKLLLLLPTLGAAMFGLLSRGVHGGSAAHSFAVVAGPGIFELLLPITCLVIGDALLGAELRSGVFSFTWLSPVRYSTIIIGRWCGGMVICALLLTPAAIAGALAAGAPSTIGGAIIALNAGAAAYLALFIAIGVSFQRPVVWSLILVILIERLLGTALSGIAQITPGWLADSTYLGLSKLSELRRVGVPYGWAAVLRLVLVTVIALAISIRRMRKLRPASASD